MRNLPSERESVSMQRRQVRCFTVGGEAFGAGIVRGNDIAPVDQRALVHAQKRGAVPWKDVILDRLQNEGRDSEGRVRCPSKGGGVYRLPMRSECCPRIQDDV
jgi:hypothetical protein